MCSVSSLCQACSLLNCHVHLQVTTLFHEMGHGLNSVLCRNRLQHLFGARGPMDVVELPSHILERIASAPAVVDTLLAADRGEDALRAPAQSTAGSVADKLIPGAVRKLVGGGEQKRAEAAHAQEHERAKAALALRRGFCEHVRLLGSLVMPRLDCALHGANPPTSVRELRALVHSMCEDVLRCEVPPQSYAWLSLNHLVTYAGMCHAYPYAETIAERIWRDHLKEDAGDAEAGAVLRDAIFKPGAALDAERALSALGGEMLEAVAGGLCPVVEEE
jgi:mitochondrial intermediate peptidase